MTNHSPIIKYPLPPAPQVDLRPVDFETGGSDVVIQVDQLWKQYRLGSINHGTLASDLQSWWAKVRGKEDPNLRIDQAARSIESEVSREEADRFWALRDVSFEVCRGDILGIIGRNGAGKSTLLKILSRVTTPTRGEIRVRGRVASLLEVGTGFHPELTGRENVFLNGSILGMSREEIRRKLDEIIAFAEIDRFVDTPVKRYSSGMYVRLAFAVAAHLDPEILVIDEVLAVGDASFQKKCIGKISEVSRDGRTVLFVSHNIGVILNLCQKAILLKDGQKIADGATEDAVGLYLNSGQWQEERELAEIEERTGLGGVRFERYWFEDGTGKRIQDAVSGQKTVIALDYASMTGGEVFRKCRASIAVETTLGVPLAVFSTELSSDAEMQLGQKGQIRCVIPELPLSKGDYRLTFFLEADGEVQDWMKAVGSLKVVGGDFFGTGKQAPVGWDGKCVLVKHQWEIE